MPESYEWFHLYSPLMRMIGARRALRRVAPAVFTDLRHAAGRYRKSQFHD
jgi:predicted HD phosphohydrolase